MKTVLRLALMATLCVVVLAVAVQPASAQTSILGSKALIMLGTTGACNNEFPGGPCTQNSTLVQLDPATGALIRVIGNVGFTVNGLAMDPTPGGKLYATTAIGCGLPGSVCPFHGLITINPNTGAGKPVNKKVVNFGLPGADSPIHSITIDALGNMVGWYDEFPVPGGPAVVTDTFVKINQKTGIATEFPDTGINTNQNGLAYDVSNYLWNIDSPKRDATGNLTQTLYLLDPVDGVALFSKFVNPPTVAAIGQFNPENNLYYGLKFTGFDPTGATFIEVIDPRGGTVSELGQTVDFLHTLVFILR